MFSFPNLNILYRKCYLFSGSWGNRSTLPLWSWLWQYWDYDPPAIDNSFNGWDTGGICCLANALVFRICFLFLSTPNAFLMEFWLLLFTRIPLFWLNWVFQICDCHNVMAWKNIMLGDNLAMAWSLQVCILTNKLVCLYFWLEWRGLVMRNCFSGNLNC